LQLSASYYSLFIQGILTLTDRPQREPRQPWPVQGGRTPGGVLTATVEIRPPLRGPTTARRKLQCLRHQIRSLVLYVDLVGSRRIWPAHVGGLVDPDGSSRIPSDRLDDQTDDQARQALASQLDGAEDRGPASVLGTVDPVVLAVTVFAGSGEVRRQPRVSRRCWRVWRALLDSEPSAVVRTPATLLGVRHLGYEGSARGDRVHGRPAAG
jgi:hypothetical protein